MESNKFDNHIKQLLEKRAIEPSSSAWSTLENRLDKTKSHKAAWMLWSGVAASFIGILITVSVFNNQPNDIITVENGTPSGMNTKIESNQSKSQKETTLINTHKDIIEVTQTKVVNSSVKKTKWNPSKQAKILTNQAEKNNLQENNIAVVDKKDLILSSKTEVEVKPFQKTVKSEAESLLAYALKTTTKKTPNTTTIDASSLLYDVEMEVDQTFRTKLFATIKENISEIKTVIVDRNK